MYFEINYILVENTNKILCTNTVPTSTTMSNRKFIPTLPNENIVDKILPVLLR